jgi:hypothetical protein
VAERALSASIFSLRQMHARDGHIISNSITSGRHSNIGNNKQWLRALLLRTFFHLDYYAIRAPVFFFSLSRSEGGKENLRLALSLSARAQPWQLFSFSSSA